MQTALENAKENILTMVSLLANSKGWKKPVYEFALGLSNDEIVAVIAVILAHVESGRMPEVVEAQSVEQIYVLQTIVDLRLNGFLPEPKTQNEPNQSRFPFPRN